MVAAISCSLLDGCFHFQEPFRNLLLFLGGWFLDGSCFFVEASRWLLLMPRDDDNGLHQFRCPKGYVQRHLDKFICHTLLPYLQSNLQRARQITWWCSWGGGGG